MSAYLVTDEQLDALEGLVGAENNDAVWQWLEQVRTTKAPEPEQ